MTHKGYRIESLGTFPMYKIMAQGSGTIPAALTGTYTNRNEAINAIERHLGSLIKGKRRDKEESTSTN